MKILVLAGLLLMLLPATVKAQSLTEEPAISKMRQAYVDYNLRNQEVRGWRVQVLVTTDRRQMEQVQRDFKRQYPDYELHFSHENPFYHLKTGAFINQQSARPFLSEMQKKFPDAFLVTDEIEMEEVLKFL